MKVQIQLLYHLIFSRGFVAYFQPESNCWDDNLNNKTIIIYYLFSKFLVIAFGLSILLITVNNLLYNKSFAKIIQNIETKLKNIPYYIIKILWKFLFYIVTFTCVIKWKMIKLSGQHVVIYKSIF
ncbi:unnamed protein product [Paramecium pentaurelia]|uniref:Uncharacterized protein n=1 Tax=Paramecium pentaurelia TaxID=43138 RepID=A0A8S1SL28_9CILI|nr:unnamed protein product [Paramecium pentaurelia]